MAVALSSNRQLLARFLSNAPILSVVWGIMGHQSFKSHQDRTNPTGIWQMSPGKGQMSVNTRHLSGGHAALFGEHAALFGGHAALFGGHAAFVRRQSPPCYPVATARGTDLIAVASSHLIATAPGVI